MSRSDDRRAWLAALLAVVYPGLGHVYLRLWLRALAWSTMAAGSVVLFLPADAAALLGRAGPLAVVNAMEPGVGLAMAAVTATATFDAYVQAARGPAADGPSCPACGRGVDEELSFCRWCAAPLEDATSR